MTNALNSAPAGRKTELLRWLTEEGRFAPDTGRLLELLCDKLAALGIPIARATVHVRTLHPEYRGAARIWRRGESIEIRTTRHGIQFTSDYQNSPIQHVIETGQWLDTMLSEITDRRFPILATLRAQGITHYVMAPLVFSNRIVNAMSWATDAPGGFAEADVELFRDLVTAFVSVLEATAGRRIYGELLATCAKLEDEYELKERADLLTRKLTVISNTGQALADIIDTERSLRLEQIIIALILLETIFTGYQIFFH